MIASYRFLLSVIVSSKSKACDDTRWETMSLASEIVFKILESAKLLGR